MGSLKEIKTRIQSVKSTQKITSAMKMVSSAKLHKAERAVYSFLPYQQKMNKILQQFLGAEDLASPFSQVRDVSRVAVVVFTSNSSLCGSYNANIIKQMQQAIVTHRDVRKKDVVVFPVGKKAYQACKSFGVNIGGKYEEIANAPRLEDVKELAEKLMSMYQNKEVDRVKLIYSRYINKAKQIIVNEEYLPVKLDKARNGENVVVDYIIEPSKQELFRTLIPKVLQLRLYAASLDASASEHAARIIAMQLASENAEELLKELSLEYNKSRQQAITNELLDIIGGSFK